MTVNIHRIDCSTSTPLWETLFHDMANKNTAKILHSLSVELRLTFAYHIFSGMLPLPHTVRRGWQMRQHILLSASR